jgi:hypothetical protein
MEAAMTLHSQLRAREAAGEPVDDEADPAAAFRRDMEAAFAPG